MSPQNLFSRRRFARSVACAAVALAAPALRAQARPEKSKIVIAVDGRALFANLPMTIAEQLGYFKEEGLDVQISEYPEAALSTHALLAGAADVCAGSFERTIGLQAKSQSVKSFVLQSRTPQIAFGVSTRSLPAYTSASDLRGKKIGVPAPDSAAKLMTQLLLSKASLNSQDVSWVSAGSSHAAISAFRTGQMDALCSPEPVMTMLEQNGDVKIISDARSLRGALDLFGGPMPAACLFASSEFVLKNPNTCQALTHAMVHSLKWLQTAGPGDLIRVVPESYLLGDRALYLASFNKIRQCISLDGLLPEDGPATALRALSRFDPRLQQVKIDLRQTYTNQFAARAKERFRV